MGAEQLEARIMEGLTRATVREGETQRDLLNPPETKASRSIPNRLCTYRLKLAFDARRSDRKKFFLQPGNDAPMRRKSSS